LKVAAAQLAALTDASFPWPKGHGSVEASTCGM
jgi:hypothetical protein